MISVVPKSNLEAKDVVFLRKLSNRAMSEIRVAAAQQKSIRDIQIFGGDWDSERKFLKDLYHDYSQNSDAPFLIIESDAMGLEEILSPKKFQSRIRFWREIELERQMLSDLECGYISSPEEFVPHDEDWT